MADAALLMIDCQMEYVSGGLALPGIEGAITEGARLLAKARDAGTPVVHVAHRGQPGGLFDAGGAGFRFAPAVAPADGEAVVAKEMPNAFAGTELAAVLEKTGRKELIVAGFMTHMCVSSSVRAAAEKGYACTVVDGATATRDLPDGRGGVIRAADLHRAALAALADRFAAIVSGADDLA